MINFRLKDIDQIIPAGQVPDLYVSWFWLTDGDLWLAFGNDTIYQYTNEAIAHFGGKATPYNDYYIVRFLEDFTDLFERISESVPENFYHLTADLKQFSNNAQKWMDMHDTEEDEHNDFYFDVYDKLISWTYQRRLDSGHLIGGPHLSFYRNKDKIRIVWNTEHTLENGISLWTAKDGSFEMPFSDFITEVKKFGETFFKAMDKQVALALAKEWGNVKVDKKRLIEEHEERKLDLKKSLSFFEQDRPVQTNWAEIEQLLTRMTNEI